MVRDFRKNPVKVFRETTILDFNSVFSRESDSTIANVRLSVTEPPQHLRIQSICYVLSLSLDLSDL